MRTQTALRLHTYGGPDSVRLDQIAIPAPGPGQVLVHVKAAGVNGLDFKIRQGSVRDAFPLPLPAVLGIELAGVVTAVGEGVARLKVGDRVMGALGGVGAYAEFAVVDAAKLALTPAGLSDVDAAALPVAALTGWQILRAAGELKPGQTVLIHGASGNVGGFAVQFAKAAGATVITTASAAKRDYVLSLGADQVIDRDAERFEDHLSGVDLVLDFVGGDATRRSWAVLAPDGAIVATADPGVLADMPEGRRGLFFMMKPDFEREQAIAEAAARGELQYRVAETVGFAGLSTAIDRNWGSHAPGKIVLDTSR